jgi:hypothetical protein
MAGSRLPLRPAEAAGTAFCPPRRSGASSELQWAGIEVGRLEVIGDWGPGSAGGGIGDIGGGSAP